MRYRPRDAEVVWEATEGEILLIDLAIGIYYSVRGATVQLVSDLMHGHDAGEILERWSRRFPESDGALLQSHLAATVDQLLQDNLLRTRDDVAVPEGPEVSLNGFELLPVEKYEDMQEIFEMDPVHDGDVERGWPVLTPNP